MPTALLIIDTQHALFDALPRPFEADAVVDRINALAVRARAAGVSVFHIQHETPTGDLAHGSAGWQLAARLAEPSGDQFVRKTTPDSFLRTDLETRLRAAGIDRLVVCGYASEFCVDTTVRRAAALGWPVVLAADAHTTQDKPHAGAAQIRAHHNATLPEVTSFGPVITAVPAAEIAFGPG